MPQDLLQRMVLGSANFGNKYGLANNHHLLDSGKVSSILQTAADAGISLIDTAPSYGQSEIVIGSIGSQSFRMISKIPWIDVTNESVSERVRSIVTGSLKNLCTDNLHAILLHRPEQLFTNEGGEIFAELCSMKEQGLTKYIGCSVYDVPELEKLIEKYKFDIIQLPLNVIDQRFLISGWIDRLAASEIQVHARSIFLQGLLLLSGDAQPNWLHEKDTALKEWRQFLFQSGYSPVEKCLEFVLGVKNISGILVGVDSAEHLNQIIDLTSNYRPLKSFDPSELNDLLIDPRRWPH
jgi:hypothetical protein